MTRNNKLITLLLTFFLLFISCTPLELFDVAKDIKKSAEECSEEQFITEQQEKGVYRDPITGKYYTVYMDFASKDYADLYGRLTPNDIGKLVSTVYITLVQEGYATSDLLYQYELNTFHIIVTETNEDFAMWKDSEKYKENPEYMLEETKNTAAFVNSMKHCTDNIEESNFTIVVKQQYLFVPILTHEFMHVVSMYEEGDSDHYHKNPKYWWELDNENSLAEKVMDNYEQMFDVTIPSDQKW